MPERFLKAYAQAYVAFMLFIAMSFVIAPAVWSGASLLDNAVGLGRNVGFVVPVSVVTGTLTIAGCAITIVLLMLSVLEYCREYWNQAYRRLAVVVLLFTIFAAVPVTMTLYALIRAGGVL